MSFEKGFDPFLEALLLKMFSRIISEFRQASLLPTETLEGADERINGSLQEDGNLKTLDGTMML